MKFIMNNSEWEIKEISNAEMNIIDNSDKISTFTHGTTEYSNNIVYINSESPSKRKTLYHELMHVFLYEYGHNPFLEDKTYHYEDVCEISACSHDIIHEIVEKYFKESK